MLNARTVYEKLTSLEEGGKAKERYKADIASERVVLYHPTTLDGNGLAQEATVHAPDVEHFVAKGFTFERPIVATGDVSALTEQGRARRRGGSR